MSKFVIQRKFTEYFTVDYIIYVAINSSIFHTFCQNMNMLKQTKIYKITNLTHGQRTNILTTYYTVRVLKVITMKRTHSDFHRNA
jgi:hypothetical protein